VPGISVLQMKAWAVGTPGPVDEHPLAEVDRMVPKAGPGQVLVRLEAGGVCRTDLVSVTANTRAEGRGFLEVAAHLGLEVTATPSPLSGSDAASADLAHGRVLGAGAPLAES
jgi:NADPH:quinone reductase-like Zn-dependent oxidoreductase